MNLSDLAKPFQTSRVSWRVGSTNKDKTKAIALAYIDARDLYKRLDDVCGPANWQIRYPHAGEKTTCEIGIRINNEWVWKANGCGDTAIEAEKGAYSDAAKRAGVPWGIGAYLYEMPDMWVEIEEYGRSFKIKSNQYDKLNAAHDRLAKQFEGAPPTPEAPQPAQFTREHKMTQRDILYAIQCCVDAVEIDTVLDQYAQELADLPVPMQEMLGDAADNRKAALAAGVDLPAPKYTFIDVKEAKHFMAVVKSFIEAATDAQSLSTWMLNNDHKLKALDVTLHADTHQTAEGSPYQRAVKLYAEKLNQLKEKK